MAVRVTSVAHQRNGVAGDPFYVALIDDPEEGQLVAIIPCSATEDDAEQDGFPCYVLGVDKLREGDVAFASNSYRGDHYYELVRAAALAYEASLFNEHFQTGQAALGESLGQPRERPSALAESS